MYQMSKFIFLILLFVGCSNKKQEIYQLQLISNITIEGDNNSVKLNSKFALSNRVILFQANSYYHSKEAIADSTVILIVNGKKVPVKKDFNFLSKKYNLRPALLNNLLFSKNDSIKSSEANLINHGSLNVVRKAMGGTIYQLYNKNKNTKKAYLNIYKSGKLIQTFKFNSEEGIPSFFLHDVNGDGKEEIFYTQWGFGYWGYVYHIKIFEMK